MLRMRLHVGYCLDARSLWVAVSRTLGEVRVKTHPRSNDSNTVLFPLLCLIIGVPPCSVKHFPLELLHPFDIRPLEIVQKAVRMQEHVTSIFEYTSTAIGARLL